MSDQDEGDLTFSAALTKDLMGHARESCQEFNQPPEVAMSALVSAALSIAANYGKTDEFIQLAAFTIEVAESGNLQGVQVIDLSNPDQPSTH